MNVPDFLDRPIYRLVLTALFVVNLLVLAGIAYVGADARVDWHDYLYPAFVGAAFLLSVELLPYYRRAGQSGTFWYWIISGILERGRHGGTLTHPGMLLE